VADGDGARRVPAGITPALKTGAGVGTEFNGATTAVLTAPTMTSGADGGSRADASITGNSLFVSNLDNLFTRETAGL
jgi:hypothetical protein